MTRTLAEIIEHAESLAARFENEDFEMRDAVHLRRLIEVVESCNATESELATAVSSAHDDGIGWGLIGTILGTTGDAAQQRYGQPAA